jgi:DNA-binding FadR family transcriptional regulator
MTPPDPNEPLQRLRAYINDRNLALNDRLPPERQLCIELGLTRTALRKAMAVLEGEGQVWRQVGRGTFIGARSVLNLSEVQYLAGISTPAQIADARLIIEPELARLAAVAAVSTDFAELRLCLRRCSEATSWRVFEAWDNRFHYAIAAATRNKLLVTVFDTLNAVRRAPIWQTVRHQPAPTAGYATFHEHKAIHDAIVGRDPDAAAEAMRVHITTVRNRPVRRVKPATAHEDATPAS